MATVALKLFVGQDHDTGTLGAQGQGNDNFFGTVVPDHIGDNYALIKSATVSGTTLTLDMAEEPIGVDKIIVAGEEVAAAYASNKLTATVSARVAAILSTVNANTDSVGDTQTATAPAKPTLPVLTDFTLSGTVTGAEGTKGQVTVTPVPSGADLPTLTYTSSHTDMATVDNKGKISFIKGGFFHITVAGGGHSKSIDGEVTNANATTFVSAEALSNGYEILVTMSDDTWYGSVKDDYEVKVNGAVKGIAGVSGHGTTTLRIDMVANTYVKGDTITVSKKVASHGVAKFTDKPVTNKMA